MAAWIIEEIPIALGHRKQACTANYCLQRSSFSFTSFSKKFTRYMQRVIEFQWWVSLHSIHCFARACAIDKLPWWPQVFLHKFLQKLARSFVKGERVSVMSCPWQALFCLVNIYMVIATQPFADDNVFPWHVDFFKFLSKETKKNLPNLDVHTRNLKT